MSGDEKKQEKKQKKKRGEGIGTSMSDGLDRGRGWMALVYPIFLSRA